jgi:hypothetical protein
MKRVSHFENAMKLGGPCEGMVELGKNGQSANLADEVVGEGRIRNVENWMRTTSYDGK